MYIDTIEIIQSLPTEHITNEHDTISKSKAIISFTIVRYLLSLSLHSDCLIQASPVKHVFDRSHFTSVPRLPAIVPGSGLPLISRTEDVITAIRGDTGWSAPPFCDSQRRARAHSKSTIFALPSRRPRCRFQALPQIR